MARALLLVLAALWAGGAAAQDTTWTPLFNGKDLTGWEHVGEGRFVVEDGLLKTEGGMGLLWHTGQPFENAVVRVVYRGAEANNAGVFIRIPEPPTEPWMPVNRGYEVQIDDREPAYHNTGVLYSLTEARAQPGRPGEWNTMEITLDGERTVVHVNDVLVTDYTEGDPVPEKKEWYEPDRGRRPAKGYIGLQNHGEEDVVYFKEISVRPLAAVRPPAGHPDTSAPGWSDLFAPDLSDAISAEGVWRFEEGVLTASEDEVLWTKKAYDDFILDLEFKTAPGTNSGVFLYGSDLENWVPNSVEIQIADDYAERWASSPPSWQAGAVFGHQGALRRAVRPPGEWNRYTITAIDEKIWVVLNGELVNEVDLSRWTSAETNPDGTEIPEWLSTPLARLPTHGHIGLQGKHGEAPIWFRNLRVRELE